MQVMARKVSEENARLQLLVVSIAQKQQSNSWRFVEQHQFEQQTIATNSTAQEMVQRLDFVNAELPHSVSTQLQPRPEPGPKQEARASAAAMLQLTSTFNDLAGLNYRNVYNTAQHPLPQTEMSYVDYSGMTRT